LKFEISLLLDGFNFVIPIRLRRTRRGI